MEKPIGKLIAGVGVGVATVCNPETGAEGPAIGLMIPKEHPVDENPENIDNYDDRFISVAAAKELLINLKDAIDAIVSGKPFERAIEFE
jgi:hypothetical protein